MPASPLPSPASTIESITREFEHSLDIRSATKGQYVVKPQVITSVRLLTERNNFKTYCTHMIKSLSQNSQKLLIKDEDKSRAEGPSTEELERVERMKAELLSVRSSDKSSSPLGSASSNSVGRHSLGPYKLSSSPQSSKERRKSAGDQDLVKQLNMFVRTRTDSGKRLTDMVCVTIYIHRLYSKIVDIL